MNVQKASFEHKRLDNPKIHIIDEVLYRRVGLARSLYRLGYHAESYESVEEYRNQVRSNGLVFVQSIEALRSIINWESKPFYYTPIVVYSIQPNPETVVSAIRAGAIDYLAWPISEIDLKRRLNDIQDRVDYCEVEERQRSSARELVKTLSPREHDILECLIVGYSNKDIARVLGISPRTVEIHRANMMSKLRVSSSALAVRIGIYAGLEENQKHTVRKGNLSDLNRSIFLIRDREGET